MFKEVSKYLNGMLSIEYYLYDKSLPYSVAFIFMACLAHVVWGLLWLFLFATCPVWICPYLIFRKKGVNKQ